MLRRLESNTEKMDFGGREGVRIREGGRAAREHRAHDCLGNSSRRSGQHGIRVGVGARLFGS